jgi:hypothetical protein
VSSAHVEIRPSRSGYPNFEYLAGRVPGVDYASMEPSLQDEAATILIETARPECLSTAAFRRTQLRKE